MLSECNWNHGPPPDQVMEARDLHYTIDENTPRGIAGWTILYDMRDAPLSFGIVITDQWYINMCSDVSDYEDFYFEKMEDLVDLHESLSTTSRTKAQTLVVHESIYDLITEIDEEFCDIIFALEPTIPTAVWISYTS